MNALWEGLDRPDEQGQDVPDYANWQYLLATHEAPLGILDGELKAVLHEALEVLAELLRSFNDNVFEDYIKPGVQPV